MESNTDLEARVQDALEELAQAARAIHSEQTHRATAEKYGIIFLGQWGRSLVDVEVAFGLREYFKLQVSLKDLREMLPRLAATLNIKLTERVALQDIGKPNPEIGYMLAL